MMPKKKKLWPPAPWDRPRWTPVNAKQPWSSTAPERGGTVARTMRAPGPSIHVRFRQSIRCSEPATLSECDPVQSMILGHVPPFQTFSKDVLGHQLFHGRCRDTAGGRASMWRADGRLSTLPLNWEHWTMMAGLWGLIYRLSSRSKGNYSRAEETRAIDHDGHERHRVWVSHAWRHERYGVRKFEQIGWD